MFVTRAAFDTLNSERIKSAEEARVLDHQNQALQVMTDWLRVRVHQLELERAQLLWKYMGVKIPVTTIEDATKDDNILGGINPFEDLGDTLAKQFGVDWEADGTLKR